MFETLWYETPHTFATSRIVATITPQTQNKFDCSNCQNNYYKILNFCQLPEEIFALPSHIAKTRHWYAGSMSRVQRRRSIAANLFMHAFPLHILGRFHNGFGEGRVGVNRMHQLVDRGLQLDGDAGFMDQVGGVGADDMDA